MFCTSTLSYFTDLLTSDLHSCKLAVDHLCEDLQVEEEFHYPAESFEVGVTGERREKGGGRGEQGEGKRSQTFTYFHVQFSSAATAGFFGSLYHKKLTCSTLPRILASIMHNA